jgi:hypothetical protein
MRDAMQDPSGSTGDEAGSDPRSAAVTFATTEHFVLQGARASTISESTGRATMFLGSVSGGLIALGLVATATQVGGAFYIFALVLLPSLAFVGLVTFERVLQTGIADHSYVRRIARVRAYYFDNAPELASYLARGTPADRRQLPSTWPSAWQRFLTIAGAVGVITAVLTGSAAGLLTGSLTALGPWASLGVGASVGAAVLIFLMRHQDSAWKRYGADPLFGEDALLQHDPRHPLA